MIDSSISPPNPTPFVSVFLNFIDRSSELLKLNASQIIEIDKLRQLPTGTFGRALADFFAENNLQPFTTGPRRKQLHDAVHVLTKYGTDPVGEAEVQAFLIGCKLRLAHVLIGLGLLRIIHKQLKKHPENSLNFSWETLWRAYQRGRTSQLDVNTWEPELLWELPLTQVQSLFKL